MKLFITGASGMVGRNLLEHPASDGHSILAPGRDELDLLNGEAVARYIEAQKPDAVIHCAGIVGGIQANIANPVSFFTSNMQMAMNVINGARSAGVKQLLNLGSSCMYPRNAVNPLREEALLTGELEPTNEGYALAKIAAARLCDYIVKEEPAFSYKTIIPCNLYGRHDKFGAHNSHMIPAVIAKIDAAMRASAQTVDIWGDGEVRREFMYAGDLADFIFTALTRFDQMPALLNVGLGLDHSINDYYRIVADVVGFQGDFEHDLTKPVGMRQKLVSTERLDEFGWTARTSLADGIRATYQFYLDHRND